MADTIFIAVDRLRLPAPDVVEALDFGTILAEAVARMKALMLDFERRDSDRRPSCFSYFPISRSSCVSASMKQRKPSWQRLKQYYVELGDGLVGFSTTAASGSPFMPWRWERALCTTPTAPLLRPNFKATLVAASGSTECAA